MIEKDSKWSWVILAIVSFCTFLEVGTLKSLSVLLPDIKEQLRSQVWIIGSCISILIGWGSVLGLSASVLVKRFGTRFCFMLSALVSNLGLFCCAFAPNVYVLLLGIVLSGFLLLQENIAIGILPEYFDKYYATAVVMFLFATGLTIIVSPLFTQIFLDMYGWRGTILMICGVNLQAIPCGAFLKNNTKKTSTKRSDECVLLPSNKNGSVINYFSSILKSFDVLLLTSVPFIARVVIPSIVHGYTVGSWIIYIVSYALSYGASMQESSLIAACGGVGITAIRIGLLALSKMFNYKQLLHLSSFTMALALALTTVFQSIVGMCITSALYGMGFGVHGTQIFISIRDVTNADQYINAIAWYHLFFGFASIVGATITGLIYEFTGSFVISFLLLSAVALVTSITVGLEVIWTRINQKQAS